MLHLAISEAKNQLTSIRREALAGKEFILEDAKRKNDPLVSLIATALIDQLCENLTFSFDWIDKPGNESETYTLWNNETGIFGIGSSRTEAMQDFISNIQEYASVYFEELPYYLSPINDNRVHYWYLRRVLRCDGELEKLRNLFGFADLEG